MLRRAFLQTLVGGIAAAAAVRTFPFRVYSFPQNIELASNVSSIRFVRCFDPMQMRMINRFDALCGWHGQLQVPLAVDAASVLSAPPNSFLSKKQVLDFEKQCKEKYVQDGFHVDGLVEHFLAEEEGKPSKPVSFEHRFVDLYSA